jgi:hypothetical protein
METFTLSLGRCWLIRAVGRNPLVRTSDRVEALILMLVFATALVVTPVAGAIGTAVHDTHARAYAEQSRDRHPVTAVVTDKPSATMIEDAIATPEQTHTVVRAPVRWRVDGVDHTETLKVDLEAKVGDRVNIWVDGSGHRVAAPMPKSQAGIDALVVGAGSWLGLMAGVEGLSALVRAGLRRRRDIGWDRELRMLVDNGGGRTGSQT